eukprot:CAMPEP_0113276542 /NCGR_PEP_ID=MMETSP0008_2-20120614/25550_1 /TAXON_ID=97485 /ORGANISM="Prymnesium parvum" /LENGTH=41 /DNA_ID=CAMNT_0000126353 /DNA_START=181 /DNA_END=306 /DNA_ORIENTATION=- /assembly_acc=CAM_ASM_000153
MGGDRRAITAMLEGLFATVWAPQLKDGDDGCSASGRAINLP